MRLLTPLQWRLYGYLRRYMFPYVLLLGVAMGVLSAASAGNAAWIPNFMFAMIAISIFLFGEER